MSAFEWTLIIAGACIACWFLDKIIKLLMILLSPLIIIFKPIALLIKRKKSKE